MFHLLTAFFSYSFYNFPRSVHCFFSKKWAKKGYCECCDKYGIHTFLRIMKAGESPTIRKFQKGLFTAIKPKIVGKTIRAPLKRSWKITENDELVKLEQEEKYQLRCRLLSNSRKQQDKILVYALHGGGFVLTKPEFHEMYYSKWISKIEDITVLAPDYTLCANFPTAYQEILDLYLWIINGSQQVESMLGFNPKKIILLGDSAGGALGISLLIQLTEIAQKDPSIEIIYPKAFVSFYGAFSLSMCWSPSKFITFFDPILNVSLGTGMAGIFIGDDNYEGIDETRPNNICAQKLKSFKKDFQYIIQSQRPRDNRGLWYLSKDGKVKSEKIVQIHERLNNKYTNAFKFNDFQSLSKIALHLFTAHYDLFLDENIEMAKIWKGTVHLHVFDNLPHGYLFLFHEKDTHRFITEKLAEVVESLREK